MPAIIPGLNNIIPTSVTKTGTTATIDPTTGRVDVTACTVISIDGIFSQSYDNYMIIARGQWSTSLNYIKFRITNAGATPSTVDDSTNYWWHTQLAPWASTLSATSSGTTAVTTGIPYMNGATTSHEFSKILIANATATRAKTVYIESQNRASSYRLDRTTGQHAISVPAVGITFTSTGNFTGEINVYGFTK